MAYAAMGDGERAAELYSLINPINHASSRAGVHKYKVEPYVIAADIYGLYPHIGRGGWTWYTGSSSWMYRAALESILGFNLSGNTLKINPCIPRDWREFEIIYRVGGSEFHILITNSQDSYAVTFDGTLLPSEEIPISDDGKKHRIHVQLKRK